MQPTCRCLSPTCHVINKTLDWPLLANQINEPEPVHGVVLVSDRVIIQLPDCNEAAWVHRRGTDVKEPGIDVVAAVILEDDDLVLS